MDVAALLIAVLALVAASIALTLAIVIFRDRDSFVSRKLERPLQKDATGENSGEPVSASRASNASDKSASAPILHAPNIAPQALAPSIGRPPIPKGGFGTKVTKRDK